MPLRMGRHVTVNHPILPPLSPPSFPWYGKEGGGEQFNNVMKDVQGEGGWDGYDLQPDYPPCDCDRIC